MKYRRIILLFCAILCMASTYAQGKFDPYKMRAELHRFITAEPGLNQQEAARFFPVYDEMRNKQRGYFNRLRVLHNTKPSSEREARELIDKADALEVQLKQLEHRYHVEMLKVLPGVKVMQVLEAERKFHRQTFRRMAGETVKGKRAKR